MSNKITFTALKSDDDFALAVASIKRRGESLQLDIHRYLHQVAVRWQEDG